MNPEFIFNGNIFLITEDGREKLYVTDAPYPIIDKTFSASGDKEAFLSDLREVGYRVNEYRPSIALNFDRKYILFSIENNCLKGGESDARTIGAI